MGISILYFLTLSTCITHDVAHAWTQQINSFDKTIEDYHFLMISDNHRNQQYYNALQLAISEFRDAKVLDAGAGSMLLSMMAMKLGAQSVLAVEQNNVMCKLGREILLANNFTKTSSNLYTYNSTTFNTSSPRFLVLYEDSVETLQIKKGSIISKPVNVFVSETFDAGLIGENYLSILSHTKRNKLLSKNAVVIPNSATVHCQLLESKFSIGVETQRAGFNFEPMRRYRKTASKFGSNAGFGINYLDDTTVRQTLSAPTIAFSYDFQNFDPETAGWRYQCILFRVTAESSGILNSLGLWFNLFLDREKKLVISNAPKFSRHFSNQYNDSRSGTCSDISSCSNTSSCSSRESADSLRQANENTGSHWLQYLYRFPQDVLVRRNDIIRLQVVQLLNRYIVGDPSPNARLVRFSTTCPMKVRIYTTVNKQDKMNDKGDHCGKGVNEGVDVDGVLSSQAFNSDEFLVATIPGKSEADDTVKKGTADTTSNRVSAQMRFTVQQGYVGQIFRLVTTVRVKRNAGVEGETIEKTIAQFYKIPLKLVSAKVTKRSVSVSEFIDIDRYEISCPDNM